jgi:hypothetical protein
MNELTMDGLAQRLECLERGVRRWKLVSIGLLLPKRSRTSLLLRHGYFWKDPSQRVCSRCRQRKGNCDPVGNRGSTDPHFL